MIYVTPTNIKTAALRYLITIEMYPLSSFEREKAIIEAILVSNQFSTKSLDEESKRKKTRCPPPNKWAVCTYTGKQAILLLYLGVDQPEGSL